MRFSKAFIPTLKDNPKDADIPSHTLMVRSGMMRKLSSGIYTYLPLAQRVIKKVETIIREELDRVGCQELLMPVLHPKEIWESSGRWNVYGPELMRLIDRHKREFALGPTHEEVITFLAKNEIKSYKELPLILYQIQTKFRDEIRPRFGVMRAREFIMKDAYSFHRDRKSLLETYDVMYEVYSRIFARCGLKFAAVEADVGAIGGSASHEFMVLAETGESEVLHCSCGYAATSENAQIAPLPTTETEQELPIEKVSTPGKKTIDQVSKFLSVDTTRLVKTILYVADGNLVGFLIRGDRELNEAKIIAHLQCATLHLASDEEIAEAGSIAGFVGPVGLKKIPLYADKTVQHMHNIIVGANEVDTHLINVNLTRDTSITTYYDFLQAVAGDACPKCGAPLDSYRGIEVGQIFQLGNKYSTSMNALYTAENGEQIPYEMGCYGIGVTRTIAAAIEQNFDKFGIIWPLSIAPYQVTLINATPSDGEITRFCDKLYDTLLEKNIEVLYDDRDMRTGFKFKDADLIGTPLHIVVGKRNFSDGNVEFKIRRTNEKILSPANRVLEKLNELLINLNKE